MKIVAGPLTAEAFAPFGDVIEASGAPDLLINQGLCGRFHDLAKLDFGPEGRVGISIFDAEPRNIPYPLEMMERHPDGTQAFVPMTENPFLVTVAKDEGGRPGQPVAFLTDAGQGVNYHRGTWHGVLTPLQPPGRFAVIDRIGGTPNLEEYWFSAQYVVHLRSL